MATRNVREPDQPLDWHCPYPHERGGPRRPEDPPCLCLRGPTVGESLVLFFYEFPELGLGAFLVLFFALKALGLF